MRIGILTYHKACNCGALIQAWALHKVLTKMGHDVSFPSCIRTGVPILRWRLHCRHHGFCTIIDLIASCRNSLRTALYNGYLRARLAPFKRKHIAQLHCSAEELPKRYDLLIVGSDQVWNPKCAVPQNYQLYIGKLPCGEIPMIGYAVSVGDADLDEGTKKELLQAYRKFHAVSFREKSLGEQLGISSPVVCYDPSLLVAMSDYDELEENGESIGEEYLFAYSATQNPDVLWKIKELGDYLGVRVLIAQIYSHWFRNKGLPRNNCVGLTPGEMIYHIRHAKYVVSSSFHGTAVAIVNGARFIHLSGDGTPYKGRAYHLLSSFGLENRMFNVKSCITEIADMMQKKYTCNIEEKRAESLQILRNTVNELSRKVG